LNVQVIGLWVLSSVNAIVLLALVARATAAQRRARKAEAESFGVSVSLGRRMPLLICRTWTEQNIGRRQRIGTIKPGSVVVFARPQSAASYRVTRLWLGLEAEMACGVAWTWVIVGKSLDASRWVGEFGLQPRAVYCADRRLMRRWVGQAPTAIFVGNDRSVVQAGRIGDELEMAQFIAGCPSKELRDWFSAASRALRSPASSSAG
jgi:hypothetical protein